MSCEKAETRLVGNSCEYFKNLKFKYKNANLNQNFEFKKSLNFKFKKSMNFKF
jgi:hypothetical protein